MQREQQGQQAQKRPQLLAEMQPEPPLLPLLEGTGRRPLRPLTRAATTSAATGAWYNASSFPRRRTCEGFPVALANLTEMTSKASMLQYRMDGV